MKAVAVILAAGALVAGAAGPALAAPVTRHFTQDVTGEVFVCQNGTYTLSGSVYFVEHTSSSANGGEHFSITVTARTLTATNEAGDVYGVHGAQWFGINTNPKAPSGGPATFTFHLAFTAPGQGVVDTVRVQEHVGVHGDIIRDTSTCDA